MLVSGPAAGLAVIIWELVGEYGVLALGPIVLMAGIIQMLAGAFRMGLWFRAVSPSVIHGMLAGIGVSIVANQLYVMMDSRPEGHALANLMLFPAKLERLGESLMTVPVSEWLTTFTGSAEHIALAIGLIAVLTTFLWAKVAPKALRVVPAPLVAVVLASLAAYAINAPINYVSVPSNLWEAANVVSFEGLAAAFPGPAFTAAVVIAFIASAETLLSAAAVDKMHDGPKTKYDKELFAQGVGNTLCGAVGALPMTGVIARSGANVAAGAKTRASAWLHAVWLLLFVVAVPSVLQLVPIAGLAGVLVVVGVKLIDPQHIRHLGQYGKGEVYIYWITLGTIAATDLLDGVLIGIGIAFAKLLYSLLHLDISLTMDEEKKTARLDLSGAATFIQLPKLATALEKKVPHDVELHVSIQELNYVDHACLELLEGWAEKYEAEGGRLFIEWESLHGKYHKRSKTELALAHTGPDADAKVAYISHSPEPSQEDDSADDREESAEPGKATPSP